MKARLNLNCDNAAFGDTRADAAFETARILRRIAKRLEEDPHEYGRTYQTLRDINGNEIGQFCLKGEDDPGYADLTA